MKALPLPAQREDAENESSRNRKPSLLLITPYSPLQHHSHAADDLAGPMVNALSAHFVLHVYAPGQKAGQGVATFYQGRESSPSFGRFFSLYPAAARKDWSRKNTAESSKLLEQIKPDFVHIEYVQPAEVLNLMPRGRASITLHDVSAPIFKQRALASKGIEAIYRWVEWVRMDRLEKRALSRVNTAFTLSRKDASTISSKTTRAVPLGIGISHRQVTWTVSPETVPEFIFAGAMWRDANNRAAKWLIEEVMPVVWKEIPLAKLRIVGANPPPWLSDAHDGERLFVTGEVSDIDIEYMRSSAVVAPSLVEAGVLLKALRSLACGVPLIVNDLVSEPIGLKAGVHARVASTVEDFSAAMVNSVRDPDRSKELSANGLKFVRQHFNWDTFGNDFSKAVLEK